MIFPRRIVLGVGGGAQRACFSNLTAPGIHSFPARIQWQVRTLVHTFHRFNRFDASILVFRRRSLAAHQLLHVLLDP
jgi:hypothetical protein